MTDQPKEKITAGPLDVFIILFLAETKRFHTCYACYRPLPGQHDTPVEELSMVRYKSQSHHTAGFETLQEAQGNISELRRTWINIPDDNVFADKAICTEWPDFTETVINWKTHPQDHPLGCIGPQITSADEVTVERI